MNGQPEPGPRAGPTPEQVLEAASRLTAVGQEFNTRLDQALARGDVRDRRRRHQIYLIGTGLLIDILLTFVVFGIVQSNHTTADRLATALTIQTELRDELVQIHDDQIAACQARNRQNAAAAAALSGFVKTFGTTAVGQQGAPFLVKLEEEIAAGYKQVDCSVLYPLPAPLSSPSPAASLPHD